MHQVKIRTYSELITLPSFDERLKYLELWNEPHIAPDRELYYRFLKSRGWKKFREEIILRDFGSDLAVIGKLVEDKIIVHHIDPITTEDLKNAREEKLFSPENLITTSLNTHNRIHYKVEEPISVVLERQPGDTKLW